MNTLRSWSTHEVDIPVHGDQESDTITDDKDTTLAYLTAVYQQPVVGGKNDATAGFDPLGSNTELSKHGYVEGLCCH